MSRRELTVPTTTTRNEPSGKVASRRAPADQAHHLLDVATLPAAQQPTWDDPVRLAAAKRALSTGRGLVTGSEVERLEGLLARAAAGEVCVLQAGDCAEDPTECDRPGVQARIDMLDALAEVLSIGADRPVIKVGRMAGQFAKPRSEPFEQQDGKTLPVYRGPAVNHPEPDEDARRCDPRLLEKGRDAAHQVVSEVEALGRGSRAAAEERIWFSHEALLLDYELPLIRSTPDGRPFLSSTHWPWIGERTRDPHQAHVQMLARTANPVSCKVSADASPEEVLELCGLLDPDRRPGRLTLVARFGAKRIGALTEIVTAVRRAGHPVVWLCDPMHGNTRRGENGLKTRFLEDVMVEIRRFSEIVPAHGGTNAGLHMEVSPGAISECHGAGTQAEAENYHSLCDPRLNLTQGVAAAAHWLPDLARRPNPARGGQNHEG